MKRPAASFAILFAAMLLILPAGAARAEESSSCAVGSTNILGQADKDAIGDVTINCTGLTENFGNKLAEVLNRILQERLDPQAVLAKLSEVDSVPAAGVARSINDNQRHLIIQGLVDKPAAQIAITAHPAVSDGADYAKEIAAPLLMVGWRIEGNEIRRVAVKSLEAVQGVAIVVRDKAAAPVKATQLRAALLAARVSASLVSDPGMAPDAALLWIGRRPEYMPEAAK